MWHSLHCRIMPALHSSLSPPKFHLLLSVQVQLLLQPPLFVLLLLQCVCQLLALLVSVSQRRILLPGAGLQAEHLHHVGQQ